MHLHTVKCIGSACLGDDAEHNAPPVVSCEFGFLFLPSRFGSYMGFGKQNAHGLRLGII